MKIITKNQTLPKPKKSTKILEAVRQEIKNMQVKETEVSYRDYKEIDDCDWHDSGGD